MTDILRVDPAELRGASAAWHMEVPELAAAPPSLEPTGGWPTMIAAAAVTGAAQAATADMHARITATAGLTQVAATSYQVAESDAEDTITNVVSTITNAARQTA